MSYSIRKYKTKSGTHYEVRYRRPDGTPTGKRGFIRKMDADAWAAEHITVAQNKGLYIDPQAGRTTINQLYENYIATKKISAKASTIRTLEIAWHTHVQPQWGNRQINTITHLEVQQWVNLQATQRSPTVVIRNTQMLAALLDIAVKNNYLSINPARGMELPKKKKKPHVYLTVQELFTLANAAGWRKPIVLTLGLCGMRWGELVGLQVKNIDLDANRIDIKGSATQVGTKIVYDTTKGGRSRRIMFPDSLRPMLIEQMADRQPNDLLFTTPNHPYDEYMSSATGATNKRDGWFYKALQRSGIAKGHMTVHDLRHTAASLMVQSGANVKAVQRQLGHTSAAMTLDTYADLFDDDLDNLSERMGRLVAASCS